MDAGPSRDGGESGAGAVKAPLHDVPDAAFLAGAIEAAGLGVLALEPSAGSVAYVSSAASEALRALSDAAGRDVLVEIARAAIGTSGEGDLSPERTARTLAIGDRVVGYSTYPAADTLWVIFRDITEKAHASSVAEAIQLSDALLGVFTTLRHDLGNSVNAAKTSLHVLRQGIGRHDEEAVRRYVDRALESLSRVEAVLATLRDYGFASRPRLRSVPVSDVVEGAALGCGHRLHEHGTALDVELGDGSATVIADPVTLQDALCDLVSRAELCARSGPDPGVLLRVETRRDTVAIRVSARRGTEKVAAARAPEGDLRLLVVRRLISQMQGTIDEDSGDAVVTLRRDRDPG